MENAKAKAEEPAAARWPWWLGPEGLATLTASGTDAHRVATGTAGWIERFGADYLVSIRSPADLDAALAGLDAWVRARGLAARRIFSRLLVHGNPGADPPRLVQGPPGLSLASTVSERGLKLEVDFAAGYSVGLFVDQRENRAFLEEWKPRQCLNCFAYTCAFTVAAARVGAETCSVDLSRRSLQRGRANLERNGLLARGRHRFFADDVLEVLPRLARRGETFEAIILDPPTFSRGNKGRVLRVADALPMLIGLAAKVAADRCALLVSTNCSAMRAADLRRTAQAAMRGQEGWRCVEPPPPADIPPGHGATTLWLVRE